MANFTSADSISVVMNANRKRKAHAETVLDINNPERKARKKNAVVRTTDKATIERIRDNAAQSPLLSLPGEIRDEILRYLLGEKCVHVKLSDSIDGLHDWDGYNCCTRSDSYKTFVCQERTKSDTVAAEMPHVSHRHCQDAFLKPWEQKLQMISRSKPVQRLDLAALGSCRQLYEEAHWILWCTNTFVFDESCSLIAFVARLNPAQRRKINSISLYAESYLHTANLFGPRKMSKDHQKVTLKTVDGLTNLQHLDLDMHCSYNVNRSGEPGGDLRVARYFFDWFKPMRALPLQQATVRLVLQDRWSHKRQNNPELIHLAQEFREALLDPEGAEKARDDRTANHRACNKRTEEEIVADYRKTEQCCAKAVRDANEVIECYTKSKNNLLRMAAELGLTRQAHQEYSHYDAGLHYEHRKLRDRARHAQKRVARWTGLEEKKRAETNRRLTKMSGETLDDYGPPYRLAEEQVMDVEILDSGDEELDTEASDDSVEEA